MDIFLFDQFWCLSDQGLYVLKSWMFAVLDFVMNRRFAPAVASRTLALVQKIELVMTAMTLLSHHALMRCAEVSVSLR